jgi:putative peptidoglycan lipid II flippase
MGVRYPDGASDGLTFQPYPAVAMIQAPSALRSALTVSAVRVLNMLLFFVLGVMSAAYFGTSLQKDCYLIAQTIPGLLTTFLFGGVYASLLVVLNEIGARHGVDRQIAFTRTTVAQIALVLLPFLLLTFAIPDAIVGLLAPGLGGERLHLSGRLLQITAGGAVLAIGLTVTRCLYETRLQFFVPCVLTLLVPLSSIVVMVTLVDRAGIFTLALGPLLGTAAAVGLLHLLPRRVLKDPTGFVPTLERPAERREWRRRFWMSAIPLSIGANFGQINLLVDNAFASYLPVGSVAALGFAFVIISNLRQLTVGSLGEVALPRMAMATMRGPSELRETVRWTIRRMVLITAPFTAGALAFGVPIVRLLFQRGKFTPQDTVSVAVLLAFYAPELTLMGFVAALTLVLLVRKRVALLAWTSAGAILANSLLDYILMGLIGVKGIALATPCTTLLHVLILVPLIRREVSGILGADDLRFILKTFACAATMALVTLGWTWVFEHLVETTWATGRALEVSVGLVLGAVVYAGLLYLADVAEARDLLIRTVGRIPFLGRP